MKLIKLLIIITASFIFITGCSSVNKSHIYSPVGISINTEMTADVDVNLSKVLTGSASATYILGIIKISGDSKYADGYGGIGLTRKVKAAAAFDAINKSNGDLLVSPQYIVNTDNYFIYKVINVNVTGFEGKIIKVKNK